MGALYLMCFIHDRNSWKVSLNMAVFLNDLKRGISSSAPYVTSFYGGNVMAVFKAQEATGH
jgi:hypothetical protein